MPVLFSYFCSFFVLMTVMVVGQLSRSSDILKPGQVWADVYPLNLACPLPWSELSTNGTFKINPKQPIHACYQQNKMFKIHIAIKLPVHLTLAQPPITPTHFPKIFPYY